MLTTGASNICSTVRCRIRSWLEIFGTSKSNSATVELWQRNSPAAEEGRAPHETMLAGNRFCLCLCHFSTSRRYVPLSIAAILWLFGVGVFDCISTCETFAGLELCVSEKHVVGFGGFMRVPCGVLVRSLWVPCGVLAGCPSRRPGRNWKERTFEFQCKTLQVLPRYFRQRGK